MTQASVNRLKWCQDTLFAEFKEGYIMSEQHRKVDMERTEVRRTSDSSRVASTFIKYAAYIIIFFGFLYFLVRYVFPML